MDVELRDIHKRFGLVRANDGISLHVPAGTIQGILGENGAGKSTLMKILSGYQPADRGRIMLNGRHVHVRSPADAIRAGVGMLHQDPMDFPPLTVLEDSLIGVTSTGPRFTLRRREALATLGGLAEEFGFSLDPHREIRSLTVGERQQLELLRLLGQGAGVLILDEPTT
ncbi:MAG: ATP-binding cassette domain-containing protein, partial [Actinobacteria bacterium]|nr:ATP-binding cassette domain-containing protein [Actinomycetota bacterium]